MGQKCAYGANMPRNVTKITLGGIVGAGALVLSPLGVLPSFAAAPTAAVHPQAATPSSYGTNGLARIGGLPDEADVTAVGLGDGRLVALSSTSGTEEVVLRLLDDSGKPVAGFGSNGVLTLGTAAADTPRDVAWSRANNRIYVLAESGSDATIWAVGTNGKADTTFGSNGVVTLAGAAAQRLAVDDSGRVVVAGANASGAAVWRLTRTGTADPSFGTAGVYAGPTGASYDSVAVSAHDAVYLGQSAGTDAKVTRLSAKGVPTASFGSSGTATISGTGNVERVEVVLQNIHRETSPLPVVVAARKDGADTVTRVDRLTTGGTVDSAFAGSAADGLRDPGRPAVLVDDRQLVLPGATPTGDPRLVQLGFNGSASTDLPGGSWTDSRVAGAATAVSLQPDGTYLASGQPASGNAFVYAVRGTTVPQCNGTYATIVAAPGEATSGTSYADVIYLTAGADRARGRDGDDTICGNEGNDTISGGAGNDWVHGGPGDDTVSGDSGRDMLIGGAGKDRLMGGSGNDTEKGGPSNDSLGGGTGNDLLIGAADDDTIVANSGNDVLQGRTGDDLLRGGPGKDVVRGGKGNDELHGGSGQDLLFGGSGSDRLHQ